MCRRQQLTTKNFEQSRTDTRQNAVRLLQKRCHFGLSLHFFYSTDFNAICTKKKEKKFKIVHTKFQFFFVN